MHPTLAARVDEIVRDLDRVPPPRRAQLDPLAAFVVGRRTAGAPVRLTFICTHNSRRSQLSQLWAAVAAAYYGVEDVQTFSGGTEATAFDPRAIEALRRAGFAIDAVDPIPDNPRYEVTFCPAGPRLVAFSKEYADPPNPTEGFAAIMTCSQADESCPFVQGAATRLAIPYVDPKASDGTPQEAATYDACARQIATEMLYVFSRVAG